MTAQIYFGGEAARNAGETLYLVAQLVEIGMARTLAFGGLCDPVHVGKQQLAENRELAAADQHVVAIMGDFPCQTEDLPGLGEARHRGKRNIERRIGGFLPRLFVEFLDGRHKIVIEIGSRFRQHRLQLQHHGRDRQRGGNCARVLDGALASEPRLDLAAPRAVAARVVERRGDGGCDRSVHHRHRGLERGRVTL